MNFKLILKIEISLIYFYGYGQEMNKLENECIRAKAESIVNNTIF